MDFNKTDLVFSIGLYFNYSINFPFVMAYPCYFSLIVLALIQDVLKIDVVVN